MAIRLKTKEEIEILREGGRRLASVVKAVAEAVKPGVKTRDLDDLAEEMIKKMGDKPAFKNYRPTGSDLAYPTTICASINEVVVHGIPSNRELKEGDIIGIDIGLEHEGMFTDMAVTVPVGKIDARAQKLLDTTKEALEVGIFNAVADARVGDIGSAVQAVADKAGYGVVRDLAGHGVGFAPHEDPFVPNFGKKGTGEVLQPGLVIAIEPMFCLGTGEVVFQDKDGFSFKTKDGKMSAHFEHTIAITENGTEVLTKLD